MFAAHTIFRICGQSAVGHGQAALLDRVTEIIYIWSRYLEPAQPHLTISIMVMQARITERCSLCLMGRVPCQLFLAPLQEEERRASAAVEKLGITI